MTRTLRLCHRISRFRTLMLTAFVLSLVGCDSAESLNLDSSTTPDVGGEGAVIDPISVIDEDAPIEEEEEGAAELAPLPDPGYASVSFAGGIPFGLFAMPTTWFGSRYNGAMRTIGPSALRSELAAIKARGGKVMLMLAGPQRHYKDAAGHFSLSKWKQRIDRFRGIAISSYIDDGTIIGHYLIDEPYDPANFNGRAVSGSTLDEMAKYSKSMWSRLPTVVRAEPYRIKWSGTYRYLDATWAQYAWRKGNVQDYLSKNVSDAKNMGLALVVGLAVRDGGNPKGTNMSPSEVQSWGSALLNSSYPCAFVSYSYRDMSSYLSTAAMKSSMDVVRRKAQNRSTNSCRS